MEKQDITFTAVVYQNGTFKSFEVVDCGHNHKSEIAARKCGKGFVRPYSLYGGNGKWVGIRAQGFCTKCGEYSRKLYDLERNFDHLSGYLCDDCWDDLVNCR